MFQGNWGDYKEVALPINDLLDQYGPNVKRAFSAEQGRASPTARAGSGASRASA